MGEFKVDDRKERGVGMGTQATEAVKTVNKFTHAEARLY
jgi:hypothetical protein